MPWQNENEDTLKAFENIFPIKVGDWEYGYRNFINFKMTVDYEEIENMTGIRLLKYLWNNYRRDIYNGKYYSTSGHYDEQGKYHYKKRYSKITLEHSCVLTGYCMDDEILQPIYDFMQKPDNRTFYDLINDCLHNWIFACNQELEYQNSDEAIIETIQANEYDFLENGKLA